MDKPVSKRAKRSYQHTTTDQFVQAMERLNITAPRLCEAIGYARSSSVKWLKENKMPKAGALACEALVRRAGASTIAKVTHIILTFKDGKFDDWRELGDKTATSNFNGQEYYMLPIKK